MKRTDPSLCARAMADYRRGSGGKALQCKNEVEPLEPCVAV